jgi:hypothetical protein
VRTDGEREKRAKQARLQAVGKREQVQPNNEVEEMIDVCIYIVHVVKDPLTHMPLYNSGDSRKRCGHRQLLASY